MDLSAHIRIHAQERNEFFIANYLQAYGMHAHPATTPTTNQCLCKDE